MHRTITRLLLLSFALTLVGLPRVGAQSGRGRQPAPPPPKPTPKPGTRPTPTVLNVPEGGKIVQQNVDGATTLYVLKNGLKVIIRERHSTPLAAVTTYVKAGYFNEADEVAGLAHLMEHMFFKGTPTRLVGTIATETRRLGGVLNASTSYEKTSYYTIAPAESLPKVLEIQADLLQHPTFDPAELKKEALVVIQESKRKQDNATTLALERMYATAFTAHRMKRWRIGSDEVLKAATQEQLRAFYQNYYQPNNIVIAIVGDVFANQIIGHVQQLYGNFQKGQVNFTPGPEEPPQEKLRYSNERGDIGQSIVTVGYHAPALTNKEGLKEQATMEMLAAVLGLGRGARLRQVLREGSRLPEDQRGKQTIVTDVSSEYLPLPGVGVLSVQLRVDPGSIDRAEAEHFREIERFRRELLSEGELQRARSLLEKRHYDSLTAANDEAEELARYQALFGDFRLLDGYVGLIRSVTAQDIQQAAAKYLTLTNTTVHEYEPRSAQARTFTPESFADLIGVFAPAALQPVRQEDVKPAVTLKAFRQGEERVSTREGENVIISDPPLPIKDFSILRGPRAYVREDHSQPKLSVGVFFQGGRLIEDQATSGTTELMLRTMLKSTTTRKADLIALELESYGGEINVVNEPDFFGFTLDVLSRNTDNAVKLLLDIIENPYFDKTELARERDGLLARQLQQRDDGLQQPIELLWASLYPDHPYGLPRYGVAAAVKGATEEKLEAWHAKTIKRQVPLVVIVGDTDGSALVSRIFSDSFKRSETDQTLKVNLPTTAAPPQEKVEQRSRKQTAQAIGFRGPAGELKDNYALAVLQNFASGLGGRFFGELRDKQSLAYTVLVRNEPRLASGAFIAYIATLPENEQRARDGLRAEMERLVSNPPSDEELERGRNAAIGSYAISLQSHPARALEYARAVIFGRKAADVEAQPDFIRAVKKEDVKRAAEVVVKLTQAGRGVVRGEVAPAPPPPAPSSTPPIKN